MQPFLGFDKGFRGRDETPRVDVGLRELLESERRRLGKNDSNKEKPLVNHTIPRKFELGQRVYYYIEEVGNEKWHSCRIIGYAYPGQDGHPFESDHLLYRLLPDREAGQEYEVEYRSESSLRDWTWARPCYVTTNNQSSSEESKPTPLVPLDLVGIDTCSALSVSSRAEDFLWLDTSEEAIRSVVLRGVGGDSATIGGRGPMVVAARDSNGSEVLIFDPSGVYLEEDSDQAEFRIFGQQRLKSFGFNLHQKKDSEGGDVLSYNDGQYIVPLQTNSGILALKTHDVALDPDQRNEVEDT